MKLYTRPHNHRTMRCVPFFALFFIVKAISSAASGDKIVNEKVCPFEDGGEIFKEYNMRHCFASCLNLLEDKRADRKCMYSRASFNVIGDNCTGRFVPNLESNKKVFCNFDSMWKPKDEVFDLDSPNLSRWLAMSNLCTHVLIYPLFKYDELTKRVVFMEDLYKNFLPHINTFKRANLKVLLTIGNWYENTPLTISPKQFSSIARNDEITDSFVNNVTALVSKFNLDGVNIRWTYPCSPLSVTDGPIVDKPNYVSLLKRLSAILKPLRLMLTSEGTGNKNIITRGIDVPAIIQYIDYYLISATDYHGTWKTVTGVSTPNKEVRSSMEYYKTLVADPSKLIVGFRPTCAVFELNVKADKLFSPSGTVANVNKKSEIHWIKLMKQLYVTEDKKWQITRGTVDSQPFASSTEKWVSFDDLNSIKNRIEMVRSLGLGGVHFSSVFDDDIDDILDCGESPVLRTVNEMLRGFGECALPTCP